jgi:hypothetical protein
MATPAATTAANNEQTTQRERMKAQQDIDVPLDWREMQPQPAAGKVRGNRIPCRNQGQEQTLQSKHCVSGSLVLGNAGD